MQRTGTVIESSRGTARVILEQHSECTRCGMCMGGTPKRVTVLVNDPFDLKSGDIVEISLSPKQSLKAAVIVYLIPLLLLVIGIALGSIMFKSGKSSQAAAAGIGLAGASTGFIITRFLDKSLSADNRYQIENFISQNRTEGN